MSAALLGGGAVALTLHVPRPPSVSAPEALLHLDRHIRDGDWVFRRGHGLWSTRFANASPHDRRYSHVGVVLRSGDTELVVLHASANDFTGLGGVAVEPLDTFVGDASVWEIRRPTLPTEHLLGFLEALRAAAAAHPPFDTAFDLANAERVYCTELIWRAWLEATGTDPVPDKTLWCDRTPIISIEDLIRLSTVLEPSP